MEAPKKNRCNGSEAARSRSVFEMGRLAPDYHVILSDFFSSLLGLVASSSLIPLAFSKPFVNGLYYLLSKLSSRERRGHVIQVGSEVLRCPDVRNWRLASGGRADAESLWLVDYR